MSDEGPPLLRPVPRRPFDVNLIPSTPPDEGEEPQTKDEAAARFLNLRTPNLDSASISRTPSAANLTSSTLYGIYGPTTGRGGISEADTPWGTGAQTPIRRPSIDDATYKLMRERSHLHRRRSSHRAIDTTIHHSNPSDVAITAMALVARGGILFALGAGYGVLLGRFQGRNDWFSRSSFATEDGAEPERDWMSLAFWGLAGLVWGGSMPWIDQVWAENLGEEQEDEVAPGVDVDLSSQDGQGPTTDWALVMRGIGAFAGIVFAMRKLAWASTLQMSVTLAMVNPLLWWIIDRSQVGLLLSAVAGIAGSLFFLGVNPGMMPAPPANLAILGGVGSPVSPSNDSTTPLGDDTASPFPLGGIASQETVESGVWMLSVLFCSCLCFGNIGRRLAWDKSATARGRWGGVR